MNLAYSADWARTLSLIESREAPEISKQIMSSHWNPASTSQLFILPNYPFGSSLIFPHSEISPLSYWNPSLTVLRIEGDSSRDVYLVAGLA
jgi:hypothetical protein